MILNPYNFVPLTTHIKLEIYYSNELEHSCSKGVSLMAINDTFTIQEINLDKKNLSYDNKLKEIKIVQNKISIPKLVICLASFLSDYSLVRVLCKNQA